MSEYKECEDLERVDAELVWEKIEAEYSWIIIHEDHDDVVQVISDSDERYILFRQEGRPIEVLSVPDEPDEGELSYIKQEFVAKFNRIYSFYIQEEAKE